MSNEGTPFTLRGSNNVFSQRQADIFGNLQALEDAHKQVHEETASERKMIGNLTWKEPQPAVESLVEQKEIVKNSGVFNINALIAIEFLFFKLGMFL